MPPRLSARVIALIVARILTPGSKLATARGLAADTARDSLAAELGIERVDEDELYAAMDWLLERQGVIEQRLAKRHLSDGALSVPPGVGWPNAAPWANCSGSTSRPWS